MSTSLIRVLASAVAVAIFAFPAVRALPDPAPVPVGAAPAPSGEAPVLAPSADKPTPGSVTESLMATPEADAPAPPAETLPIFKAEQLDQLLAPVALYPDALLAQILMAATYPLEVVKADRWLQDSIHANLQGDQLATAIEAEAWDPSVKSLVPFPRILRMMDGELDWTEQLGHAVMAQQADVMDSIQRLRHQAAAAGTLWSNSEQRVTTERQGVVIEPSNPAFIYPPVYNPSVYGPWPYPDYPPLDVSSPDYGIGFAPPFGIGFGVGFAVVQPMWRWCAFDWGQRRIQLDIGKFNMLNHNGTGIGTETWRHDLGRRRNALHGDLASHVGFPLVRDFTISTAVIPRVNVPSAGTSSPTIVTRSASPAFSAGPFPTTVLRSPEPGIAPSGRGLQARIKAQPGFAASRTVTPEMMPPGLARLPLPRTAAHSTPAERPSPAGKFMK